MKIKTSELTGPALAYAVSLLENRDWEQEGHIANITYPDDGTGWTYRPDEDWAQGGPIIEREKISVELCAGFWRATRDDRPATCEHAEEDGSTPLIAAMRCFVASKLGDEVDVPEELLN